MNAQETLRPLLVTRKVAIARDIYQFDLRDLSGASLPAYTAGAHLAVRIPNGAMRQYSLCSDPNVRDSYQIAVKRDIGGRGGSVNFVDGVQAGDTLFVGAPKNLFELSDKAKSFVFIAGGIGITPFMAMIHSLKSEGLRKFKLYYFTRDPDGTAFLDALTSPEYAGSVVIHHDLGDPSRSFDLWKILERPIAGTHLYCCGPTRLMAEVKDMTGHWPSSAVHFESFGADVKPHADDKPFDIVLQRSGMRLTVPAKESILETLRKHSVHVPSSCESGTCGSCKVHLLDGQADHRDLVLLDEEKPHQIMVCVSRARSDCLVLDL